MVNSVIRQTFQKMGLLKSYIHEATIDLKTVLCFLCNVEGRINASCQQHQKMLRWASCLCWFVMIHSVQMLVSEQISQGKLLLGCGCVGDVFKSHGYFWLLCGHRLMHAFFSLAWSSMCANGPQRKCWIFFLLFDRTAWPDCCAWQWSTLLQWYLQWVVGGCHGWCGYPVFVALPLFCIFLSFWKLLCK